MGESVIYVYQQSLFDVAQQIYAPFMWNVTKIYNFYKYNHYIHTYIDKNAGAVVRDPIQTSSRG